MEVGLYVAIQNATTLNSNIFIYKCKQEVG